jgi:hypothetical protein
MNDAAREQLLMHAVVTEHLVTQAARSAIVSEMTARATIYMGAVSGALIAFGFLAQTSDVAPFVSCVLPALVLFGELTFAALFRNSLENIVLLRHIRDIHSYYQQFATDEHNVFDASHTDPQFAAAVATIGVQTKPAQALFTGASTIAVVNAILVGVGVALIIVQVGGAVGIAVAAGVSIAAAFFASHLWFQQRGLGGILNDTA